VHHDAFILFDATAAQPHIGQVTTLNHWGQHADFQYVDLDGTPLTDEVYGVWLR
jgi:hypothetical protein